MSRQAYRQAGRQAHEQAGRQTYTQADSLAQSAQPNQHNTTSPTRQAQYNSPAQSVQHKRNRVRTYDRVRTWDGFRVKV